jgi:hypothetical protein
MSNLMITKESSWLLASSHWQPAVGIQPAIIFLGQEFVVGLSIKLCGLNADG